ncbi:MAG: PilZ domain-containing protein [Proteobacteria bacterium]|nr:PilZ domain-containing protein [Pseudomonadota bacterium]NDC23319.1 PilZ domain-containing protein [Pseudomonadota bacterium]NDD03556.1 PilZ domain-containing protein [Pseudomonadota bacterium]NDG25589.1 PilZ domain-containing protein [Pseudomonadota bacterium]
MDKNFVEKRQFYRLPFGETLLMTDGNKTVVGGSLNISRGGIFLKTLEPLTLDSRGFISFMIPGHPKSLCLKAKVAHLVFDRQRAEVDCGMGLQFLEIDLSQQKLIDDYIDNQQSAYLALQKVVNQRRPSSTEIEYHLKQLSHLREMDLSSLRYRVNRICTIFEKSPSLQAVGSGKVG